MDIGLSLEQNKHMASSVDGFSKWTKSEKIKWVVDTYASDPQAVTSLLEAYWHTDPQTQQLHDEFIENTLTNFYLPFGVAPNFLIDGVSYTLPMVIEESSVVAAASKSAKYWASRGGFHTRIIGTDKIGQVHFTRSGGPEKTQQFFDRIQPLLLQSVAPLVANMEKRGGGIRSIELVNKTQDLPDYYQLFVRFGTADAMGANFINSCLEQLAQTLKAEDPSLTVVMSILSNYVPDCTVRSEVCCPVEDLGGVEGMSAEAFAEKIKQAVDIARVEPYRAVTHNKGIMNGIDAVVLATGNDFRAIEAGVHAYAAKDGRYTSLTQCSIEDGVFKFWIEVPLSLGTVGGLTQLHPLVKWSLEMLGTPSAQKLMGIVAAAGLAQNWAAVQSLVTTGIQKGHMKMHLLNILNQLGADQQEKAAMVEYFKTHTVQYQGV
ncbi:MAG: 3-hydroxy-3-methylglutaryl-coenzyme reductase, partial [Bacteroidota bacterium]